MRRAPIVAAAVALAVPAAAAAQTPAGIPDIAQMAVARADLPPGVTVEDQGSLPLSGYVGYYYRTFRFPRDAARQTGVKHLESDVALLKTRPRAASEYSGLRSLYRNTSSGRTLVRLVADLSGITVRHVRIGAERRLAIGRARGARMMRETRAALAAAADRLRRGLSPVSVSPPGVSGTAQVGAVLHASAGSWGAFTKPTSFAYAPATGRRP